MKKTVFILLFLKALFCHAQSKQVQSMLKQIAVVMEYANTVKKGYDIVSSGLHTIKDIKNGDFNLHKDFIDALKNINPKIAGMAKVADIVSFQLAIVQQAKSLLQHAQASNQFTDKEISYFKNVFDHLLDECSKSLDELIAVTTSGNLQMTDDERIKRIDRIYAGMQDKLSFSKSFSAQASSLATQRMAEQNEINRSRVLYGIQ